MEVAVTLVLKSLKCKTPTVSPVIQIISDKTATLIDEIGAMLPVVEAKQRMIKALQAEQQPYTDRMKALTVLLSAIEGPGPDETFRYQGSQFIALAGKRCIVRRVSNPALAIELLNEAQEGIAWQVISVPLGKLDAYLTPEQRAQVITVDRGDRPVTIAKKPGHNGS
jgi:hypothetical protein